MNLRINKPISTAVLLIVVLVLAFYVVLPKYQQFQGLLTEIGKKEAEFQGKNAYFIEVTSAYRELMLYQDALKKIDTALPDKLSIAPLVDFLYQKGLESGIIVRRISVSKSSSVGVDTNVKEASLNIELFGSYPALVRFLASLEKSSRIIEGDNFSFSVTPPSSTSFMTELTYPISLSIKVYSY
ncbi:MAG: type 4a pilus biogenesis protein PilO [Candidatus Staskawiczbacteria bacterium]|jgi:Tfp pilus assembly protein PilO